MITKHDYAIGALLGFLVGIFALPTLINLGLRDLRILAVVPLALPPIWVFGLFLGKFLSRWLSFLAQFSKFAAVGFLNTTIDFGVLNILSMITGVTAGFVLGGVNIPGFAIAIINSYFFNKFWVFKGGGGILHDFPKFLGVTLVGLLINSALIILITTYIPPLFAAGESVWLNMAKAAATITSLFWNFLGFKFFVFRSLAVSSSEKHF